MEPEQSERPERVVERRTGQGQDQRAKGRGGGGAGGECAITPSCKGVKRAHLLPCDLQCHALGTTCLAPQGVAISPAWARGMDVSRSDVQHFELKL